MWENTEQILEKTIRPVGPGARVRQISRKTRGHRARHEIDSKHHLAFDSRLED